MLVEKNSTNELRALTFETDQKPSKKKKYIYIYITFHTRNLKVSHAATFHAATTEKRIASKAERSDWSHCCSHTQKRNTDVPFGRWVGEPKQLESLSCFHVQVMVCITFHTRNLKVSHAATFHAATTEKRIASKAERSDWSHCCSHTQKRNTDVPFPTLQSLLAEHFI